MPYNKGDFTQQGVKGHVNATVRLNEKRLVNIDLTSNEEAEGCTIAGAVTDLLNNEVYPIGAGVSGNIEITENGENINVAPYATATVNVSGGGADLRKCTVKIVNTSVNNGIVAPYQVTDGYLIREVVTVPANGNDTAEYLYGYDDANEVYMPFDFENSFTNLDINTPVSYSDLVNITTENYMPVIVDESIDSSFTITCAFSGGI